MMRIFFFSRYLFLFFAGPLLVPGIRSLSGLPALCEYPLSAP